MNLTHTAYLHLIGSVEERVLAGGEVRPSEAEQLITVPDEWVMHLAAAADRIRIHFRGSVFDACSLINARSGRCSEDCAFCAQSVRYPSDCAIYGLRSTNEILYAAGRALEAGASRFCTVTSGGALSDRDFDSLISSLERVRAEVDIALDASLGFLTEQQALRLYAAGVTRYNHNLETSRDYFSRICTTHTFDQRVETVKTALSSGFSACCGGIIGMGETLSQRLSLAFSLAELGVDCVPINILDPRPGTPLQDMVRLHPLEIIRTIAVFRLILPKATLKIAGGRERNLGDFQGMALRSGANGMIIGGYLTTSGRSLEVDLKMIEDAGFQLERLPRAKAGS
jgi:biotin synthase